MSERTDYTISKPAMLLWGSVLGLATLFGCVTLYSVLVEPLSFRSAAQAGRFVMPIAVIIGVLLHEWIHVLGYRLVGGVSAKDARFVFLWKILTPAAHCAAPIRVNAYRVAMLAPLGLLGIIPFVVSLILGSQPLGLFGSVFIAGGVGDVMIFMMTLDVPGTAWIQDHPSDAGCTVVAPPQEAS